MTNTMKNTISTWTLKNNYNRNEPNFIFYYESNLGDFVKFQSHQTKSAYIIIGASDNLTNKDINKVVKMYVLNGFAQHEYQGGFKEAIQTLIIK